MIALDARTNPRGVGGCLLVSAISHWSAPSSRETRLGAALYGEQGVNGVIIVKTLANLSEKEQKNLEREKAQHAKKLEKIADAEKSVTKSKSRLAISTVTTGA